MKASSKSELNFDIISFWDTLSLEQKKTIMWDSNVFVEGSLCSMFGWVDIGGRNGHDAFCPERNIFIEIKTSSYTGNGDIPTTLSGGFTISDLSYSIAERAKGEEIHIFGKDNLTKEYVYHISISGEELYPHLIEFLDSKPKNYVYSRGYNLYKDFKSLKVHDFNLDNIQAGLYKYSSGFVKFLMGDVAYENMYFKNELTLGFEITDKVLKTVRKDGTKVFERTFVSVIEVEGTEFEFIITRNSDHLRKFEFESDIMCIASDATIEMLVNERLTSELNGERYTLVEWYEMYLNEFPLLWIEIEDRYSYNSFYARFNEKYKLSKGK